MKKLSTMLCCLVLGLTASAQITETPEGVMHDNLYRHSDAYVRGWTSSKPGVYDGAVGKFVEAPDGTLYIFNPFSSLASNTWLKLDKVSDGKYVAKLPQLIYSYIEDDDDEDEEAGEGVQHNYYAQRMVKSGDTYVVSSETSEINFTWNGSKLEMENTAGSSVILGVADKDKKWYEHGSWTLTFSTLPSGLITPPAGAKEKQYQIAYTGSTTARILDGRVDGNDIYVKGLSTAGVFKDAWVKFTIDGDKVKMAGAQYLGQAKREDFGGYSSDKSAYHVYAMTCKRLGNDELELKDEITFDYDAARGKFTTKDAVCITIGYQDPNEDNTKETMRALSLTPYSDQVGNPEAPTLYYCTATPSYDYEEMLTTFAFYVKNADVDGNYLSPDSMYYNIFINDAEQPYTFVKKTYSFNKEDMTDIPYMYKDSQNKDIKVVDNMRFIHFYDKSIDSVAVQMVYKSGDKLYKSELLRAKVDKTASVHGVELNPAAGREEYFDLEGRRLNAPVKGINIVRRADGKTYKVLVK